MTALRPSLPVFALLAALSPALAQEGPEVAAYTVVNGVEIPEPLAGRTGDAERGRALFRDWETGGCAACHRIGGRGLDPWAPRVILDALPPPPPPPPEPEEPEAEAPDASDAPETPAPLADAAPEAPAEAPMPKPRGWTPPPPAPDAAEAGTAPPPELEGPRAADLGLRAGPDLTGIGLRMSAARIRLWIVEPSFFAARGMPAYHAVDFEAARIQPDLRQPWLSPQQVEDVLAYLLSLGPDAEE